MNDREPSFFAGRRISMYFRGGRLMKDHKTEQRFWRLKWALTLVPGDAHACGGAIQSTYEHIQARENAAEEIVLAGCTGGMIVHAYPFAGADAQRIIRLDSCFCDKFKMTYAEGETEFWVQVEHPMSDSLHTFVKDYAFQRFWVEFEAKQEKLFEPKPVSSEEFFEKIAEVAGQPDSPLQKLADRDGVSMSISAGGKTLAEFKPKGKVH